MSTRYSGPQLIESRDPFESNDVLYYYELSKGLVEPGHELVSGVELLSRSALPGLFAEYEIVSHW